MCFRAVGHLSCTRGNGRKRLFCRGVLDFRVLVCCTAQQLEARDFPLDGSNENISDRQVDLYIRLYPRNAITFCGRVFTNGRWPINVRMAHQCSYGEQSRYRKKMPARCRCTHISSLLISYANCLLRCPPPLPGASPVPECPRPVFLPRRSTAGDSPPAAAAAAVSPLLPRPPPPANHFQQHKQQQHQQQQVSLLEGVIFPQSPLAFEIGQTGFEFGPMQPTTGVEPRFDDQGTCCGDEDVGLSRRLLAAEGEGCCEHGLRQEVKARPEGHPMPQPPVPEYAQLPPEAKARYTEESSEARGLKTGRRG